MNQSNEVFVPALKKSMEFQSLSGYTGIEIFRSRDQRYFLKRYVDASSAQKEKTLLTLNTSFKKPTIVDGFLWEEKECLVLENARVNPRMITMTQAQTIQAAEVLAKIHELHLDPDPVTQFSLNTFHSRQKDGISTALLQVLSEFRPIGDALCHFDLHLSNWLIEDDVVVGILNWIAYGYGDPEEDLAGLILESGQWKERESVLNAWQSKTGRIVDARRFLVYFWLLAEEKQLKKALTIPQQESLNHCKELFKALPSPSRRPRVLIKPQHQGLTWVPYPKSLENIYVKIQHPRVLGACQLETAEVFTEHACNDVLRLKCDHRSLILKIYNKPNENYLPDLELHLAKHLQPPAYAVAPIQLNNGGHLFRIKGHLASLYLNLGDQRLDNSNRSLRLTVRAQAALHRCPIPNSFSLPALPGLDQWSFLYPRIEKLTSKEQQEKIERIITQNVLQDADQLPRVISHGSLHRDHTIVYHDKLAIIDWEKSAIGPRVRAVARSALFLGYRDNDEQLSPEKIVRYCVYYHQENPFNTQEIQAMSHFIIGELIHDLKAISQTIGEYANGQERIDHHIKTIVNFDHNKASFQVAFEKYLALYQKR